MRTLIVIIPLAVSLLASCATPANVKRRNEADAHYKLAVSHLNRGQMQAAFVELQKSLQLDPRNKETYNALGLVYRYFENMEEAEKAFKTALRIDPEYSEAYNNLGVVYMGTGLWDKAIEAFEKALENPLYGTPQRALTNLGKCYYRKGEIMKALDAYKKAINRAPDFHVPYYELALCYNALGRYGDASEAITEAINLDPLFRGDRDKAEEELRRRKLKARDLLEEQDYSELLEILRY